MATVTVSPKFQVVIPKAVRESLGLKSGQKIQIFSYENRIEFIPLKPMAEMRGFLKGIDTSMRLDVGAGTASVETSTIPGPETA